MFNLQKAFYNKRHFVFFKIILLALVFVILLLLVIPKANAVCTSLDKLEKLLKTQKIVMKNVEKCIHQVIDPTSKRILQRFVDRCKKEHYKAKRNSRRYVENPINAYTLIGRLSRDLDIVEDILKLKENTNYKKLQKLTYVSETDLEDVIEAIFDLVLAYKLKVSDLSNGILRSNYSQTQETFIEIVTPMTSVDCYELAMAAYSYREYDMAHAWMLEVQRKYQQDCDEGCMFTKKDITKFLNRRTKNTERSEDFEQFLAICRDEVSKNRSLTCQYRYGPHPFLRLARFKVELLHLEPNITMFHDVISDDEIAGILTLASERSDNSTSYQDNRFTATPINDFQSNFVALLSLRVLDMTGLSATMVEKFNIISYGVAGFDHSSIDGYFNNSAAEYPSKGVRHTTVKFFLSHVSQGGATIFNQLGLTIFPVKNSAVVWSNLLPSGDIDPNTVHATCPVLHGTKWVTTEWLSDYKYFNTCRQDEPRELKLSDRPKPHVPKIPTGLKPLKDDENPDSDPILPKDTTFADATKLAESIKLPVGMEMPYIEPPKPVILPLSYNTAQQAIK